MMVARRRRRLPPIDNAWISPTGEAFDIGGAFQPGAICHYRWAEREGLVPPSADDADPSEIIRPLILAGWIRQAAPASYEAIRSARPRVLRYVRETYPHIVAFDVEEWDDDGGRKRDVRLRNR